MGKTLWARSLGSHIYFAGMFNLEAYDDTCTYAIFDDILGGLTGFSTYKQWLGAQMEFTATDKYKRKRTIHWRGRPTIWITNDDPSVANVDHDWLDKNATTVYIDKQIATVIDWPESPQRSCQ